MSLFRHETTEQLAQRYERWNRGQLYRRGPVFWQRFRSRRLLRRLAGSRYAEVMGVLDQQSEQHPLRAVPALAQSHEQSRRDLAA